MECILQENSSYRIRIATDPFLDKLAYREMGASVLHLILELVYVTNLQTRRRVFSKALLPANFFWKVVATMPSQASAGDCACLAE